jgi:hypothetical protein
MTRTGSPWFLTGDQAGVARLIDGLMGNLLARARVIAARAGVDDLVAAVLVVLVAAADDDRVGALGLGAANSGHCRPVDAGARRLNARLPGRADRDTGKLTKNRSTADSHPAMGAGESVGATPGWLA